jgi:hypothetical protein
MLVLLLLLLLLLLFSELLLELLALVLTLVVVAVLALLLLIEGGALGTTSAPNALVTGMFCNHKNNHMMQFMWALEASASE